MKILINCQIPMYFLFILPYMDLIAKIDKLRKLENLIMFKMRTLINTHCCLHFTWFFQILFCCV